MDEFDLTIGTQVFCIDGKCGKLAKYAVDLESWQVTHLIVEDGFLLKRSRVFPFPTVWRATPDEIQLSTDAEELRNYPEFREEVIEKPAPEYEGGSSPATMLESAPYGHTAVPAVPMVREKVRYGISEELAVVERGTPISGLNGQFGKLDHFLVSAADGVITQLVAQQGLLFTTKRIIPVSLVEYISEGSISVAATEETLKDLPQYGPQDEPQDVSPEIGQVWEAMPEKPAATGDNNPVMDRTTQVSQALFEDPLTKDAVIEVIDERGVITLQGEVNDLETHAAAGSVAARQPGVISVVNALQVKR